MSADPVSRMEDRTARPADGHLTTALLCVVLTFALLLLAALITTLNTDRARYIKHGELAHSGVRVAAQIVRVSYDPDAGDPGGWTTLTVRYRLPDGSAATAQLGHHYPAHEKVGGTVTVLVDQRNPTLVDLPGFDLGEYQGNVVDDEVFVVGASLVTLGVLGALVVHLWRRRRGADPAPPT